MNRRISDFRRAAIALAMLNALVSLVLSKQLPEPYMDEVFHVGQFRRTSRWIRSFLAESLEWDLALTTFPGLYLISSIFPPDVGLMWLRLINAVALNSVMFFLIYKLTRSISTALAVVLMPLNWFFSHLYYTDTVATLSVLVTVYLFETKQFTLSGFAGFVSVLMRQTNIVWLFGLSVAHLTQGRKLSWKSVVYRGITDLRMHALVGLTFIAFYFLNGNSIVLGHHEHHSVSLHTAQVNYALLTWLGVAGPSAWSGITQSLIKNARWKALGLVFVIAFLASELGTVAHPFILSDNRHYSFYFYRYFVATRYIRSLVIPAIVAVTAVHSEITSIYFRCFPTSVLLMCIALCVIPTPLLEFRYFNVFLSLALAAKRDQGRPLIYLLKNTVLMFVFLYCPFKQGDQISRFMF